MQGKRVVVYDPNSVNPYGTELSFLLASLGRDVHFWCTSNRRKLPSGVGRVRPVLAASRWQSPTMMLFLFGRLLGPLRLVFASRLSDPLVIVWTRGTWDALILLVRCVLGGRTALIYHNPAAVRGRGGLAGHLERLLASRSHACVVHSDWLLSKLDSKVRNACVVPHPPYSETTEGYVRKARATGPVPSPPVVAFVGAMRADKGSADFVDIARAVDGNWILRVLGPDKLSPEVESELRDNGVTCEYPTDGKVPTDDELISGLLASDLMIAPYRSVTESGSVHMALGLNVGVLAYYSKGLARIINEGSLALSPEGLGVLMSAYFNDPWITFTADAIQLEAACAEKWRVLLDANF